MYRWLQAIWYGQGYAPFTLRGLALIYGLVVRARAALYRRGWIASTRLAVPVIVIGNITAGGTGKTPLTLWLSGQLAARGLRVGIVLRGHGGTARAPMLVAADSGAAVVGDEAVLLRNRSGCEVAIGARRAAAAQLLVERGAQLIIADDGLQHYALQRDMEIAVIDGTRGFGNGRLLPAGPLREPRQRLQQVALVVQNGGGAALVAGALRMELAGEQLLPVAGQGSSMQLQNLAGRPVHAVAAIGNPARFFALLRGAGLEVREHAFPDHHPLSAAEVQFGDALPVLMTEKDAVKGRAFAAANHWYLPVEARFNAADEQRLLGRVFMDAKLLEILVCPLCKGPLQYERAAQELICRAERLAFPIRDDIPVMLEEEARQLASDDPLLQR
jgi:tetraacyldisaccharide 4'-kinase